MNNSTASTETVAATAAPTKPVIRMTVADRVYSAVQDAAGLTAHDYAHLLDIPQPNVSPVLTQLHRHGYLRRDRINGTYRYYAAKPRKMGTSMSKVTTKKEATKKEAPPPVASPTCAPDIYTVAQPSTAIKQGAAPVLITVQGVPMTVAQARAVWTELNQLFA